jgi:hypothetical protein
MSNLENMSFKLIFYCNYDDFLPFSLLYLLKNILKVNYNFKFIFITLIKLLSYHFKFIKASSNAYIVYFASA